MSTPGFDWLDLVQGNYSYCGFLSSVIMSYLEDSILLHFSPSSGSYVLTTFSSKTYLETWYLGDTVDRDVLLRTMCSVTSQHFDLFCIFAMIAVHWGKKEEAFQTKA